MPGSKQKRTTAQTPLSTSEFSSHPLPEQQAFHQQLRTLAQSAVRTVIELVMREELDAFIGAAWGECSPKRKGYRNGTYPRDLVTSTGRLEDINVPRDREGQFHTQVFERYRRYEPHIAEGLTQMFVAGTSTHKVGEVAQTLMGVAPSASTISRLNQTLTQQFDAWRQRPLQDHWRILYLDGVHFSIRHGEKADATIILTALAVDLAGNKEVLARRSCAEESKEGWLSLLQDLRSRGATHIDLIVTDGHDGRLSAVAELFAATPRQRCLVHKQRNVLNAIPRRERGDVQAELVGIWEQPTWQEAVAQLAAFQAKYSKRYPEAVRSLMEDEEHLLTFYQFPQAMHRHIQTTNAIESLFSNVRQRTDQIDVFTTETSCLALTALAVDLEGNKEVLALRACAEESKEGWLGLLHDLRTRGASQIDLIVTDGHDGLLAAVAELFSATPRQRCLVHKQRNVLAAIPRRERGDVQAELVGIWQQPTKPEALTQLAAFKAKYAQRYPEAVRSLTEDEEHLLTFYAFPQTMHRHIQSSNAIESLFSNVRQRTDQIDVFTTETSCLAIVWATIQDIRLHKISLA